MQLTLVCTLHENYDNHRMTYRHRKSVMSNTRLNCFTQNGHFSICIEIYLYTSFQ